MASPARVVIFDTETTGLSPATGDRIVEIGCVELIGFDVGRTYHSYINPQRDVPEEVIRVHGLTGHYLHAALNEVLYSSLMAETMYAKYKNKLVEFAPKLTHYHRLVERFGLIEDIRFCLTPDVANVLPVYQEGKLVAK